MKFCCRHLLPLLLCALLLLPLMPGQEVHASASFTDDEISIIVDAAVRLIMKNEVGSTSPSNDSYTAVNKNDNGALSIGLLQWHANRALTLMKNLVSAYEAELNADELEDPLWNYALGSLTSQEYMNSTYSTFYEEIKQCSDWSSRTVNANEAAMLQLLLGDTLGQAMQHQLMRTDVTAYVKHGISVGVTDPASLVYFSDIENQFGYTGVMKYNVTPTMTALGKDTIDNLNEFHTTLISVYEHYTTRRINSYNWCLANLCSLNSLFHYYQVNSNGYDATPTTAGRVTYTCMYCGSTLTSTIRCTGPGDLSGDGNVTAADVYLLTRYLLGIYTPTDLDAADMDTDGDTDSADLAIMVSLIE